MSKIVKNIFGSLRLPSEDLAYAEDQIKMNSEKNCFVLDS